MNHSTKPEVVVITGASARVGRATARAFARRGAPIGLLARGLEGLKATQQEVVAEGGRAIFQSVDMAHAEQVEAAAQAVEREFGAIDVWSKNAMVSVFSPVKETPAEEFRRVTEVTYLGTVHGTLAALRRMLPRDRGTILQIGAALAYRGIPLQAPYCAAKHAVQGFTEALRCELLHDGSQVRLTMVHLPAMNTPQFGWVKSRMPRKPQPVPPIFQPEIAADAIVWAAHHDRRERQVGAITTATIWGSKVAPGWADRYLATTGYESQQTMEPEEPDRRDNLWQPVPGDHGVHGDFDDRARNVSWQWWANRHRGWLTAGAGAMLAFALFQGNHKH